MVRRLHYSSFPQTGMFLKVEADYSGTWWGLGEGYDRVPSGTHSPRTHYRAKAGLEPPSPPPECCEVLFVRKTQKSSKLEEGPGAACIRRVEEPLQQIRTEFVSRAFCSQSQKIKVTPPKHPFPAQTPETPDLQRYSSKPPAQASPKQPFLPQRSNRLRQGLAARHASACCLSLWSRLGSC